MNERDNTTTLWALDVVRRYAPHPLVDTADYHVQIFKRQCERDAQLREVMAEREEEPAREQDAEDFFLEQQCPSDATFR